MKVWLLFIERGYLGQHPRVVGVYATKELAESDRETLGENEYRVEEWAVDEETMAPR